MSKATYYVNITTLYTQAVGTQYLADPNQAYGVLVSNSKTIPWPADLTTVKISGLTSSNSIAPTVKVVSGSETFTFGQYYYAGASMPWPADFTGTITVPATISSSSSALTSQSLTASSGSVASETDSNNTEDSISSTGTSETPTSTSSSRSSHAASSHSSGLSPGATAGIAIGCVLAGLAIGLIVAFSLFRRKGKRNDSIDNVDIHNEPKAYPSGKGTPIHDVQLNQFMLEATPDRDIAQEVQSIGALIDQHVETYYHTRPINIDRGTLASSLAHIGFPSNNNSAQIDAQSAAVLCLDPRTRQVGLRHVIMRTLFSSIDTHSPNPSMLPAPVASFIRAIPPAESDRYADSQANSLALRKWRNLSAFLLHPARSQRTSLPIGDAAVAAQAQGLASSLNSFLRFFAEGQQQQQQQQQVGHLQAVIAECAKLGYMLFSHPSDWGFVYEVGATQGVVVEAGLDKLGDRDGAPYPSPRRLVEPVVVSYQSGH